MRAALPLVLALLAAACSVDVEGAACTVIGSAAECPGGQVCGTGRTCSARASSCTPCSAGARACEDGAVKECTPAQDPACGTWMTVAGKDCVARGLVCDAAAGPECRCAAHEGNVYVVDAAVGGDPANPAPTGNASPAVCRFRSLTIALAAAASSGASATVRLAGAAAEYGTATGDAAPIVIPAHVTVTTEDEPFAPETRVLLVEEGATEGVSLAAGATLAGVTVRNVSAPAAIGVRVACGAGDPATIDGVRVESAVGAPKLATGIRLEGECAVTLRDTHVLGAAGAGLEVARATRPAAALVAGALLHGNGFGVRLAQGDLRLERSVVRRSLGVAVDASGTDFERAGLTVLDSTLHFNDDTALLVSALDRLDLQGTRTCGNEALTDRGVGTKRKVGGLYGSGAPPPALTFKHNQFFGNAGDQVAISGSNAAWHLDGASSTETCEAEANIFAGYATDFVGLVGNGAAVTATWNSWAIGVPAGNQDYKEISPGTVDAGAQVGEFCSLPAATGLDCPAAPPR
jgi:hypothetical protein